MAVHESKQSWEKFRDDSSCPACKQGSRVGSRPLPKRPRSTCRPYCLSGTGQREPNEQRGDVDMIANNRISAVLVSTDLARSQQFYESKVGLTLSPETIKNHLLFECGDGTTLLIYGRGSGNKADHTQVASGRPTSTRTSRSSPRTASSLTSTTPRPSRLSTTSSPRLASAVRPGSRTPTGTPSQYSNRNDPPF